MSWELSSQEKKNSRNLMELSQAGVGEYSEEDIAFIPSVSESC